MAQTAAVKQSKANARAQKQLGHNTWRKAFMQHYWLYIMMLPALLYMIIFNYLPMTGLYMAFTDFSPFNGDTILESVFGSPFVGLKYFKKLFTGPDFWTLFRNTLSISLANLFFAFPAPIILALILNELRCKWFKRTAQTLVYIPHFVSIVIVAALTFQMFSTTDGAIYHVLTQIFGANAPDLLSDPKLFPALIVGQNIWKETGYGTIIYLAALSVGLVCSSLFQRTVTSTVVSYLSVFALGLVTLLPLWYDVKRIGDLYDAMNIVGQQLHMIEYTPVSFTLNPGLGLFSLLASQTQMFSSILWQFSYSLANTYSYLPFDHFLYCNMAFLAAASVLLTALAALNLRVRKPRAPKGSKRA